MKAWRDRVGGALMRLRSLSTKLAMLVLFTLASPGIAHGASPPTANDLAGMHVRVTFTSGAPELVTPCGGSAYDGIVGSDDVQTVTPSGTGWTARANPTGGRLVELTDDDLLGNSFDIVYVVAPDGSSFAYDFESTFNCSPATSAALPVGGQQPIDGSQFIGGPGADSCAFGTLTRTAEQTFALDFTLKACGTTLDLTGLSFSISPFYEYPQAYDPCVAGGIASDYLEQLTPLTPTVGGWTLSSQTLSAIVTQAPDGSRSFGALGAMTLVSPDHDNAIHFTLSGSDCETGIRSGAPTQLTLRESEAYTDAPLACVDLAVEISSSGGIIATTTGQNPPVDGACASSNGGDGGSGGASGGGGANGGGVTRNVGLDGTAAAAARSRLGFRFANAALDEAPTHHVDPTKNVSWSAYVLTWGRDQTYTMTNTTTGELLPDPDAQALYNADKRVANSGGAQCFGFASIAALRAEVPSAPDFPTGAYNLADRYPDYDSKLGISVPDSSISIFQDIHARFMIQDYGRAYLDHRTAYAHEKVDASTVRTSIEQALNAGQFPVVTYFFNSQDGGIAGHAVVALGIRDGGTGDYGHYQIITLDSNFPIGGSGLRDPTHGIIDVKDGHYSTIDDYFVPVSEPVDADTIDVVPMRDVAAVYPRASWTTPAGVTPAGDTTLSALSTTASQVVIRTMSARVMQLAGTGTHLFSADNSIDRTSAGIPNVAFTTDETGANSEIDAPADDYTLTVSSPQLGDVEVTRGNVSMHVALPASSQPVKVTIPADASQPVRVQLAGQAQLSLVQRVSGGDFRIATLRGPAGLGLSIMPSGELEIVGSPTLITLSALGRHYAPQTATLALDGGGMTVVRPAWAEILTKPVRVMRARKRHTVHATAIKIMKSASVRVRQKARSLRVTLRVRAPRGATVTARVTLRHAGHLVERWTATTGSATFKANLRHETYTVSAAISAVTLDQGYSVQRRVATAHT